MSGPFYKTYMARSVAWSSLVATLPLVVLALLPAVVRAAPWISSAICSAETSDVWSSCGVRSPQGGSWDEFDLIVGADFACP